MLRDRFLGCFLGGALGDALGYPIEFVRDASALELAVQDGGLTLLRRGRGEFSDDTQMTLFSAEALVRAHAAGESDPTPFALGAYQRWYSTQQMSRGKAVAARAGHGLLLAEPQLFARRAPGNTCLGALAASFMKGAVASVQQPPNFSKGCGAVMRAAPFGLAAQSREQAFVSSRDAAVLTHGHPSGYLSAAYLASLVFDAARGVDLVQALPLADALLEREPEHEELAAVLAKARVASHTASSAELVTELGEGWVGEEALGVGLACALAATEQTAPNALCRAVAHAGDSDSTGSIAGNLIGARFGVAALPPAWLAVLELRALIERVAADLYEVTQSGAAADPDAYPSASGTFTA